MEFATSSVLSIPYRRTASSPRSPIRAASRPSQHHQHVGERDVRMQEREWIAALLGGLECPPELRDALVGAAEVGEVSAEVQQRPGSTSSAPTVRAIASACSPIASDSSKRQASINPCPSAASACARSAEGGSAGTRSTTCSKAERAASVLPLSCR